MFCSNIEQVNIVDHRKNVLFPFNFVGITQVWYDVCILYFSGKHGHTVHAMALKF